MGICCSIIQEVIISRDSRSVFTHILALDQLNQKAERSSTLFQFHSHFVKQSIHQTERGLSLCLQSTHGGREGEGGREREREEREGRELEGDRGRERARGREGDRGRDGEGGRERQNEEGERGRGRERGRGERGRGGEGGIGREGKREGEIEGEEER